MFQFDRLKTCPRRLLVIPMHWERWCLLGGAWVGRRCFGAGFHGWRWRNWLVVSPGIGIDRSRDLAARLQELSVDELWLVGICGGIDSTLQSGDLVIVVDKQEQREFQDGPLSPLRQLDHGELSFIGLETLHGTKFRGRIFEGTGVCSAGILSRAEKLELAQTGSAGIVEMESSAWRTWSTAKQIPMFHLRVVCDPVNQEPPKPRIGRPTPNVLTGPEASESRREKFGQGLRDLWTAAKSLRQLGACLSAESAKKN